MPISATTELLGEHPELLDIAIADIEDGQITSWVRGGDGLIGFGVYKSHTVKGPDRFEQARRWWRAEINSLNIANNSHGLGSGPILFTSFSFDEAEATRQSLPFLRPFRPTLFWNPSITNDGSRLSIPIEFWLNEKEGPILVEVRGITELGEPIYGTFLLNESLTRLPLEK